MQQTTPTEFKAVPFLDDWIGNVKLDLKAIYRRPVWDKETGEQALDAQGMPRWDTTGPLPVIRHAQYLRKGFEYVTLADMESLSAAAPSLQLHGYRPSEFIMRRHRDYGPTPWFPKLYLASQATKEREKFNALEQMVQRFGSEAVLAIKRADQPGYELPAHLRDLKAGDPIVRPTAKPADAETRTRLDPSTPSTPSPGETTGPLGPAVRPIGTIAGPAKKSVAGRTAAKAAKKTAPAATPNAAAAVTGSGGPQA